MGKERTPEIMVEVNLGSCDIPESSIFLLYIHYPFDCTNNIKYETSSHILFHVIRFVPH